MDVVAASAAWAPSLVERGAELAAIDRALARPGQLVVVEGPAGIGKSALVAEAHRRADHAGAAVLWAAGWAHEQAVAFGVASRLLMPLVVALPAEERRQLLGELPPSTRAIVFGELPDAAPASAAAVDAAAPAPSGAGEDEAGTDNGDVPGEGKAPSRRVAGVVRSLLWLCERLLGGHPQRRQAQPVLVCLDDAQWSDDASLRLVLALAARRPALPVTILLAVRLGEQASPLLDVLRGAPDAVVVRPALLSADGVAEVVRRRLGPPSGRFVAACHQATGGNPFLLGSLLDELAADHLPADDTTAATVAQVVPATAGRSVLTRLGRLPAPAIALARAVAVLGDHSRLALAGALADLAEADVVRAADMLADAGLLQAGDPVSFTHPLMATIVAADLPPFARAAAHRRAADILAAAGAPPAVVAAHLAGLSPQGDPWVVSALVDAAADATAAGEHHSAARLLARAVREPPAPADRAAVHQASALAAARAGWPDAPAALRSALDRLDAADPDRRPLAAALARLLVGRGAFAEAADVIDQVRATLGTTTELQALWLMATSRAATRRADALGAFEPLLEQARHGAVPDDPLLAARLATRAASAGADPAVVRRLATAALTADPLVAPGDHGIAFAFVLAGIYWIDELSWCQRAAEAGRRAAERSGSPLATMAACHWQALATARLGLLDEAVDHAEQALLLAGEGWRALAAWTHAVCAQVHLERNDLQQAHRQVAAGLAGPDDMLDRAFVIESRGWLALAEDRPADALADATAAGRHLAERYLIDHPGISPWRSLAARAALCLGRHAEAQELAEAQVALARPLRLARPLADALRTVAVVRGGADGLRAAAEAVALLDDSEALIDRAHAVVQLGMTLRRCGRISAARAELGRGLRLAETAGAARLAAVAEAELRSAGGRRRAASRRTEVGDLTATQLRVAELAADGLTNAAIAARLFLSVKTVEWHLGAVYRQLGISGRSELAAALDPPLGRT
jgi:DNA-binding CsgD family transcriptional regulator